MAIYSFSHNIDGIFALLLSNPIILHEVILFGFYACSVSLSVISCKHSRSEELIQGGVLGERTTAEGRQSPALMAMAARTAAPS